MYCVSRAQRFTTHHNAHSYLRRYEIFCRVQKHKKVMAADTSGAARDPTQAMADAMGDAIDVDEEELIDGFPIDCGTADRKFLSMAK